MQYFMEYLQKSGEDFVICGMFLYKAYPLRNDPTALSKLLAEFNAVCHNKNKPDATQSFDDGFGRTHLRA
jgi:hypothetical protein